MAKFINLTQDVNEHEFLTDLMQTIQDLGLENKVCDALIKNYGYDEE